MCEGGRGDAEGKSQIEDREGAMSKINGLA